jgi:tetratricopeptide (TPR) repeat protein
MFRAIKFEKSKINCNPNSLALYYSNQADNYEKTGRTKEAIVFLKKALDLYPTDVNLKNSIKNSLDELNGK